MFYRALLIVALVAWPTFAEDDPFQWLEEIESPQALSWVKAHNDKTVPHLTGLPIYSQIEPELRKIVLATDRIAYPTVMGEYVYNFWQDKQHVRGIWRRTSRAGYLKAQPDWETVLDLDALAKSENENWVWKGADCLAPAYERCLLSLSRGGKDAVEIREWDTGAKQFVEGGFRLPEAKHRVAWKDRDTLLTASDFGPGTMTLSGYPRIVKSWKRGTSLSAAPVVFEGKVEDMIVEPESLHRPEGSYVYISRRVSFFEQEAHWLDEANKPRLLPLPLDVDLHGAFENRVIFSPKKTLVRGGTAYVPGTLLALPLTPEGEAKPLEVLYVPSESETISQVVVTRSRVLVNALENVRGKLVELTLGQAGWRSKAVELPTDGTLTLVSATSERNDAFILYESFLTPPTLYELAEQGRLTVAKQLPARFDASGLESHQYWVTSRDGTKVPYFVVHRKGLKLDGSHPTLLYGYGGFLISEDPSYLAETGKVWLERGGVYAVANIRGGGEFGPKWHQAALKENRQKAFDDFIAVAEDLIARKITSPRRLGIRGGSNGGLLVGTTFVQRPELFNAVVCQVPLLDMLRFHKLLAGHSWIGEYGNPDVPAEREFIARYSPYQNVKAGVKYPKVFFLTSTKDDRVHPGHARKMVAKMESLGHDVYYYENMEGGHGGAANLEQRIHNTAMYFTYLFERLADGVR